MLSLDQIRDSGSFTGAPVKREVTWEVNGEEYTADVYVRRLSYQTAVSDAMAVAGHGDLASNRIAHCIVDENGKPVFKVSDITGFHEDGTPVLDEDGNERGALCSELALALLAVIGEVNNLGKPKPQS